MMSAIKLNDQPRTMFNEIEDVSTKWNLAAKVMAFRI
jgi:hypothetical protein